MEAEKLLRKLIEKDTTNPPGNEFRTAKIVTRFFDKSKIKYKIISKNQARPNIIGFVGKGKPKLMIACHSDVVPAGDGWKTDPFKAVKKGNKIYGRGAIDNKGPLASLLVAAKELKKIEDRLKGQLIVAAVADEEQGSEYGLKYVIRNIKPDYAIIPDVSGNMERIVVAEKGLLWLKATFFGKQAHGSRPEIGDNAIHKAARFIELIKDYQLSYRPHRLLGKPSINVGKIEGGTAPNMVAGRCDVILDIRLVHGQNKSNVIKEIKQIAEKCGKNKIEIIQYQAQTEVNENNRLVEVIKKNAKIAGKKPKLYGLEGATVSKMLVLKGIPAVGFSIGDPNLAHQANEYIKIKELNDFVIVIRNIVIDFLS